MTRATKVDFEAMVDGQLDQDRLARLGELVTRQLALEDEIETTTQRLKQLGEDLRGVSERDIPELLLDTGLSEVRLADGTKVLVRNDLKVRTTGEWRQPILEFLVERGLDDVIKDELTIPFGKGQDVAVQRLSAYLSAEGYQYGRDRTVHAQTFAALLRELLANHEDVPLDALGAYMWRHTKLVRPK
jgi:hypothetical protein